MCKIAIIGAGWIGCHLATKLEADVKIFDKQEIFAGSSFYNQNRLHFGFHYPRNYSTRNLCYSTSEQFMKDYHDLVSDVDQNIYAVPYLSTVDFQTICNTFCHEKVDFQISENFLENVEGSIRVNEKYIDFQKSKNYFSEKLSSIFNQSEVNERMLSSMKNDYDLILNCTNNFFNSVSDMYFEVSLTLLYEKVRESSFGAVTLIDGNFFSIYPFRENIYTLTDVEHTPVFTSFNLLEAIEAKNRFDDHSLSMKRTKFESKVFQFYPEFLDIFRFRGHFLSMKSKKLSNSADRYPIIRKQDNIVDCVTGKIQGIYPIQQHVIKIVDEINSR